MFSRWFFLVWLLGTAAAFVGWCLRRGWSGLEDCSQLISGITHNHRTRTTTKRPYTQRHGGGIHGKRVKNVWGLTFVNSWNEPRPHASFIFTSSLYLSKRFTQWPKHQQSGADFRNENICDCTGTFLMRNNLLTKHKGLKRIPSQRTKSYLNHQSCCWWKWPQNISRDCSL